MRKLITIFILLLSINAFSQSDSVSLYFKHDTLWIKNWKQNTFIQVSHLSSGGAETDPIVRAINGIVKSNGTTISAAIVGTDYLNSNQAITVTARGDATGTSSSSGTVPSIPLTLATVNSNIGTFNNLTINAKGLATAGSNISYLTSYSETDPTVKAINGLVKSNGSTISAATAGTDYLTPTGSAASLTSFPTLNQSTTGNAGTATTLQTARTINGISFDGSANINIATEPGQSSTIAASAAINTTETVITNTSALAANRLVAGTVIRITLYGTTTASVSKTSTFSVRIGTTGTTSDGLMLSSTTAGSATSGTAVPFKAVIDLTVRTTGTTATCYGFLTVENTGGTSTGISTVPVQVLLPTFTAFNTTTANSIISATYKSSATSCTSTFQQGIIEIIYL